MVRCKHHERPQRTVSLMLAIFKTLRKDRFIAAARKVSDRIAVMLDGRIIEEGSSNVIVTTPKQDYTKRLLNVVRI
jgi:ABC-type microcin C transport system duplicated ATPase subunit YejF